MSASPRGATGTHSPNWSGADSHGSETCFGGSTELADELSQQVFLKAWRKLRLLNDPERFGAWMKRVAINEWIDHQRKFDEPPTTEYDDNRRPGRTDSVGEAIDLDAALATLPGDVRLCVVLSYHERLSHAEIADLTGMPAGTIKSHIRRGSQKLRLLLEAYGESS